MYLYELRGCGQKNIHWVKRIRRKKTFVLMENRALSFERRLNLQLTMKNSQILRNGPSCIKFDEDSNILLICSSSIYFNSVKNSKN